MSMHPIKSLSDNQLLALLTSIYSDPERRRIMTEHLMRNELPRVRASLEMLPKANGDKRTLVDIGAATFWLPAYQALGYERLIIVTKLRNTENLAMEEIDRWAHGQCVETVFADVDLAPLPFPPASIDVVCCFELLEHLALDPMLVVAESNRVLKAGGYLLLSTPNIASWEAALKLLRGKNPNLWSAYSRNHEHSKVRHHREYTAMEVERLLCDGGFHIDILKTAPLTKNVGFRARLRRCIVQGMMLVARGATRNRERNTFVLAQKTGPVVSRYPDWLYHEFAQIPG